MAATNLGTAYIKIAPQMSGIQKSISDGLAGIKSSSLPGATAVGTVVAKGVSAAMNLVTSSLDGAIRRTDILENFPRVMKNLGISTEDAQKAINKLSKGLDGLPTSLQAGAMAVQRFTSRNNDVKKSTEIFLALNNAILAGGASAEIQTSALEQMSQAYAKGKPDMMEWRTLMMAMPAQLNQLAESMGLGKNAADKLGEGLRKGEISMDDFMNEIIKLNKKGVKGLASFEEQARGATAGIGTAMTNMRNRAEKAVSSIIQSFGSKNVSDAINKFSSSFKGIADWISANIVPVVKNTLIPVLKNVLGVMKNIVEFIAQNKWVQDTLMGIVTAMLAFKAVNTVKTAITGIITPIINMTQNLLGGVSAFKQAWSAGLSFSSAMGNVASSTTGATSTFAGLISGASKVVSALGPAGIAGIAGLATTAILGVQAATISLETDSIRATTAMREYQRTHYDLAQAARDGAHAQQLLKDAVNELKTAENAAVNAEIALIQARQSEGQYLEEMNRLKQEGKQETDEYRLAELQYTKALEQEKTAHEQLKQAQLDVRDKKVEIDDLNSSGLYRMNLVIGTLMRESGEYGNLAASLDELTTKTITYKDEQGNMVTASKEKSQEMVEGLAYQLTQGNETWRAIVNTAIEEGISFSEACAKYGKQAGDNAIGNFSSGARNKLSMVSSTGMQVIEKLADELGKGNSKAYDAGKNVTKGAANGVNDNGAKSDLFAKARAVILAAIAKMRAAADEHSPSKVTAEIGKFMSLGLAKGIDDYAEDAVKSAEAMTEKTMAAMNGTPTLNSNISQLQPQTGLTSALNGSGGQVIQYNDFNVDSELDVKEISKRLGWQVATAL